MGAKYIVVGLGKTGVSCVRFLAKNKLSFEVVDTRDDPPGLKEFRDEFPLVPLHLGKLDPALLKKAATLVVSPGLSVHEPVIEGCAKEGISIIGDIELFCREAKAPIVAITGSNAKGTVTTLVGDMAKEAGWHVKVGGNIGTPALDLLDGNEPDLYVLELSSFQLETTYSLKAKAATILNISPDHLDRYPSLQEYILAKQRIYHGCESAIVSRDDEATLPITPVKQVFSFGLSQPNSHEFGMITSDQNTWLAQGDEKLLPTSALKIKGQHNWANALAALAFAKALALPLAPCLKALQAFSGLPHRCQWVGESQNVHWYNDSKGTNVGATLAAIEGLGKDSFTKLVLIAGGLGKGADFSCLRDPIANYVRTLILIGKDAPLLADALQGSTQILFASSMEDAVVLAKQAAMPNDAVLLSPACASMDMFRDYGHRGEVFTQLVQRFTE